MASVCAACSVSLKSRQFPQLFSLSNVPPTRSSFPLLQMSPRPLSLFFPFSPSSLREGCDFGHSTHSLGRFSSCLYIPKQPLVLVAARAPLCPSPSGTSQPSDSSDAEEPPCLEPSQPSLASAGACPAPRSHTGHFTVHEVKRILLFSSL